MSVFLTLCYFPVGTQRSDNVASTSMQRCIDVDATLYKRHEPARMLVLDTRAAFRCAKWSPTFLLWTPIPSAPTRAGIHGKTSLDIQKFVKQECMHPCFVIVNIFLAVCKCC